MKIKIEEARRIRVGALSWREEAGASIRPLFIGMKTPLELGYTKEWRSDQEAKND